MEDSGKTVLRDVADVCETVVARETEVILTPSIDSSKLLPLLSASSRQHTHPHHHHLYRL